MPLESSSKSLKKAQGQFPVNLISGMVSDSNDPVKWWKTQEVGWSGASVKAEIDRN